MGHCRCQCSVADPGCLSRIPDPTFFHPGSELSPSRIPDPRSSTKNLCILTPKKAKKWFLSSKNMMWVVHPGSRIRMLTFSHPGSRIQGSKRHPIPDPGSRIRIRNTLSMSNNKKRRQHCLAVVGVGFTPSIKDVFTPSLSPLKVE